MTLKIRDDITLKHVTEEEIWTYLTIHDQLEKKHLGGTSGFVRTIVLYYCNLVDRMEMEQRWQIYIKMLNKSKHAVMEG
jgi:hypothetical protein